MYKILTRRKISYYLFLPLLTLLFLTFFIINKTFIIGEFKDVNITYAYYTSFLIGNSVNEKVKGYKLKIENQTDSKQNIVILFTDKEESIFSISEIKDGVLVNYILERVIGEKLFSDNERRFYLDLNSGEHKYFQTKGEFDKNTVKVLDVQEYHLILMLKDAMWNGAFLFLILNVVYIICISSVIEDKKSSFISFFPFLFASQLDLDIITSVIHILNPEHTVYASIIYAFFIFCLLLYFFYSFSLEKLDNIQYLYIFSFLNILLLGLVNEFHLVESDIANIYELISLCVLLPCNISTLSFRQSMKLIDQYQRDYHNFTYEEISSLPNVKVLKKKTKRLIDQHIEFTLCAIEIDNFSLHIPYVTYSEKRNFSASINNYIHNIISNEDTLIIDECNLDVNRLAILNDGVFCFVLLGSDTENIVRITENILTCMNRSYAFNNFNVDISSKIGICNFPKDSNQFDGLLNKTFHALNEYKSIVKPYNQFDSLNVFYKQMNLILLSELKLAIISDELELFHQVQMSLENNTIYGSELLVRWNHPKYGYIPPETFISISEEAGLINQLTRWVINKAFYQQRKIFNQGFSHKFSVNISARDITQSDLVHYICELSEQYKVPLEYLSIELTETSFVQDMNILIKFLVELRKKGIDVSIDDYGTGYSSLSYLSKLPFTELKIDREFIRFLLTDEKQQNIVKSTTSLSKNLGLKVVAEGVENKETLNFLSAYGVDVCQGFYFSKPLKFDDHIQYINSFENTKFVID